MALALGIDTGGTYTDAVLVDYETGEVLRGAKALTTKEELSTGIREAIDQILDGDAEQVCMVALSTTLATNAIVEGKGAPICLLLFGYDPELIADYGFQKDLVTQNYVFLPGRHNLNGDEDEPLDLDLTRRTILEWKDRVEAFAISGYFGTRNPTHEQTVRDMVVELAGLPTTCGHELTSRLNSIGRATTVALNARLIPFLHALMESVEATMAERGIDAPLMVVRGDGALMDARMAKQRPVETILSGPAASVIGAKHLNSMENGLVVDVGGTTTDIAVLRDGRPGLNPEGARVGQWRTMVEAVDMRTAGIGGDSHVHVTRERTLEIGPRRVVPLCILAHQHPEVLRDLKRQLMLVDSYDELAGEFMLPMRPISRNGREMSEEEAELIASLSRGPRSLISLTSKARFRRHPLSHLYEWEDEGYLMRAGFTPTDATLVLGLYDAWNAEAARAGAELLARMARVPVDELCRRVVDGTSDKITREVLGKVLEDDRGLSLGSDDSGGQVLDRQRPWRRYAADFAALLPGRRVAPGGDWRARRDVHAEGRRRIAHRTEHSAVRRPRQCHRRGFWQRRPDGALDYPARGRRRVGQTHGPDRRAGIHRSGRGAGSGAAPGAQNGGRTSAPRRRRRVRDSDRAPRSDGAGGLRLGR